MRLNVKVGQKIVVKPSWRWATVRKPFEDTVIKVTFNTIKTNKMTFRRSDGIQWGKSARHGWKVDHGPIDMITNEEALENG